MFSSSGGKDDVESRRAKRRSEIPSSFSTKENDDEFTTENQKQRHSKKTAIKIRGSKSENSLSFELEDESFEVVRSFVYVIFSKQYKFLMIIFFR